MKMKKTSAITWQQSTIAKIPEQQTKNNKNIKANWRNDANK